MILNVYLAISVLMIFIQYHGLKDEEGLETLDTVFGALVGFLWPFIALPHISSAVVLVGAMIASFLSNIIQLITKTGRYSNRRNG